MKHTLYCKYADIRVTSDGKTQSSKQRSWARNDNCIYSGYEGRFDPCSHFFEFSAEFQSILNSFRHFTRDQVNDTL